jgi:hypothetical protein
LSHRSSPEGGQTDLAEGRVPAPLVIVLCEEFWHNCGVPESPKTDTHRPPDAADWRKRAEDAERERERLRRGNERLRQQVEHLKRQLDDARRPGFRQAAPFAKPLKKDLKRPGRKTGHAYGRKGHRRMPPRVDERYEVPLPAQCPTCTGSVVETVVVLNKQLGLSLGRPHAARRRRAKLTR